ncbi:helix-turn-helix domain-containing protein [Actinomadura sp. WMMB 499]|uniref:helix-turn-helix domain-containing protein n=1 Tax=Actinomadura sp. WMMB 499 TaxID=1219491 RepID=UPI00159E6CEA|nr:helix-turn-helix transcriptional regulator [Actinomadura sp. WMMB 499]
MSESDEIGIGERLRFYRQGRKKTQAVVAGLAGVSEDYVSQIERGLKTPTIGMLHKFARILGVQVSVLLGEPEFEQNGTIHPVASELNRRMMSFGRPGDGGDVDLAGLRRRVDAAWEIWQTSESRFTEGAEVFPALLSDVQVAARSFRAVGEAEERREAARLASDMYFLLRTFAKRIGRTDLSLLAADRGIAAAYETDDPLRIAGAHWNLAHILIAQNEAEAAEETAVHAIEELKPHLESGGDWLAMSGALWLVASVASVRQGDAWAARDRLRQHALPAAESVGEGNVLWTVFGPTNVLLHAMSVEMEAGESAEGLTIADRIDVTESPSLERQTTFYLELARLHEQRRDDAAVLLHLMSAEGSGPEDLRYNVLARDLVRGLLRRARPSMAPQVRALARRVGVVAA